MRSMPATVPQLFQNLLGATLQHVGLLRHLLDRFYFLAYFLFYAMVLPIQVDDLR